jgi:hypothetical protein
MSAQEKPDLNDPEVAEKVVAERVKVRIIKNEEDDSHADPHPQPVHYVKPTWEGPPPELARQRDILSVWAKTHPAVGLAGEEVLKSLAYLALTSRVLEWGAVGNRPVSLVAKGPSSSGKSFATAGTIKFFPEGTAIELSGASSKFMVYDDESYAHRFIYVAEYSGIKDDDVFLTTLRTLLSEGHFEYGSVDTTTGRPVSFKVRKEGPTGLIVTTTQTSVHPELETRLLSTRTDDTPMQTRRIFRALAELEHKGSTFDYQPWHDLQRWIEAQNNRVEIPFIGEFAELMPATAVRTRRDFTTVMSLVRAHAILHQANRKRGRDGRILATLDDYEQVRQLIEPMIAEGSDAHVPEALIEVVDKVDDLYRVSGSPVTTAQLLQHLKIGKGALLDRIKRAVASGYLTDLRPAGKYNAPWQVAPGEAVPEAKPFLPTPEGLRQLRQSDTVPQTGMVEPKTVSDRSSDSKSDTEPQEMSETASDTSSDIGFSHNHAGLRDTCRMSDVSDGHGGSEDLLVIGDDGYHVLVNRRHAEGHLTDRERETLIARHRALRKVLA